MDAKKVLIFISGLVSGVVGVGTIIGILLQKSKNFSRWFAKKTINFIFELNYLNPSNIIKLFSEFNIEKYKSEFIKNEDFSKIYMRTHNLHHQYISLLCHIY